MLQRGVQLIHSPFPERDVLNSFSVAVARGREYAAYTEDLLSRRPEQAMSAHSRHRYAKLIRELRLPRGDDQEEDRTSPPFD